MHWSKAKTILLLLMLCVNIYLGANVIIQLRERDAREEQMARTAISIITGRGVQVDEDTILDMPEAPSVYIFERDSGTELEAAQAFLGQLDESQPGGGIVVYTSEKGQLTFRSGGYVEFDPAEGADVADLSGLLSQPPQSRAEAREENGAWSLYIDDAPVYGAYFTAEEDGWYSGSWLFSTSLSSSQEVLSRADMILALGRALDQAGEPKADRVSLVYILSSAQSGGVRLIPAWMVTAGEQEIYLSLLTGEPMTF